MTICGIAVHHKYFGHGVVSGCDNKTVIVTFSRPDGSKKVTKFLFPDAFMEKFLVSFDPRLDKYIQNYIKERTCPICGQESPPTKKLDGKRLCNSCVERYTKECPRCNQVHLAENFSSVDISGYPYYISMCKDCFSQCVHKCDSCHESFIADGSVHSYKGKVYCDWCYQRMICTCDICGEEYLKDQGEEVYKDDEYTYIDACPECIQEKTFICSECGRHVFKEYLVDSKYIPAKKQICNSCVRHCSSCGETVDSEHSCMYFDHTYCKECEALKKTQCPICGDEFIPDETNQRLCPNCVNATEHMKLTQKIDFSSRRSKVVYDLDCMDRCKLFTNLYENCDFLETGRKHDNQEDPYHYLVMHIMGYNAIVTYLPRGISTRIRCSANVTMTELRSRKGRFKVYSAIVKWLPKSDRMLHIPEGEVRLLYYPVLIRAQTKYDKIYGKEWRGQYDYIEIGNYGDTTNFYIIGVLRRKIETSQFKHHS